MYKLKQCPFCGSKHIDIYIKGNENKKYAVVCNDCDARAGRKKTKQAAADEWNKRYGNEQLEEFCKYWFKPNEVVKGYENELIMEAYNKILSGDNYEDKSRQ